MRRYLFVIPIVLFVGFVAFNYSFINQGRSENDLPVFAQRTPEVETAYRFAVDNPELLDHIPCYCNCYKLGHTSVKDCFIKEFKEDGKVVFDEHGSNCGTCYYTVLDSKRLFELGKSTAEIRDFVDNKYSKYGLGTNTPKVTN